MHIAISQGYGTDADADDAWYIELLDHAGTAIMVGSRSYTNRADLDDDLAAIARAIDRDGIGLVVATTHKYDPTDAPVSTADGIWAGSHSEHATKGAVEFQPLSDWLPHD